jgi:hypothetical protein
VPDHQTSTPEPVPGDTTVGSRTTGTVADEASGRRGAALLEPHQHAHGHHGRPISWVLVAIILAGFVLGGIALIIATLWLFCLAAGVVVLGGLAAWRGGVMEDYTTDQLMTRSPR